MSLCKLCHRKCGIDRRYKVGFCETSSTLKIARASLHFWEEPCISGTKGSGTIFFSYCNLKCVYCQNRAISRDHNGGCISIERFSEICLELQRDGALNINLVTPTHYVPEIIKGLKLAKKRGLNIPVIYNTSSYETVETIKSLNGLIDIYLPDMKYYSDTLATSYSSAPNYFSVASRAIEEMVKQVGKPIFTNDGVMLRGVIVRHLLLPTHTEDSKKVLSYLYNTYKDDIYISIMNQYTQTEHIREFNELNQKVTEEEYDFIIDYAWNLGIRKGFIQEGETCLESFIPDFSNQGV